MLQIRGMLQARSIVVGVCFLACTFNCVGAVLDGISHSEIDIDGSVDQMLWFGERIFVRTANNTVYRSYSNGKDWMSQMDLLDGSTVSFDDRIATAKASWGIAELVRSPVDEDRIVFLRGVSTLHWITLDAGNSYLPLNSEPPIHIEQLIFHSVEKKWALAGERERCDSLDPRHCCYKVYITKNLGEPNVPTKWSLISGSVQGFEWASNGGIEAKLSPGVPRVILTRDPDHENTFCGAWDSRKSAFVVDNHWENSPHMIAVKGGNVLEWANTFLYVAAKAEDNTTPAKLYVSSNKAVTFSPIQLPEKFPENGYSILDSSDHAVFLEVKHAADAEWGHLYASDAKGLYFTKVKEHLHCESTGVCDFLKSEDVLGTYLANSVENGKLRSYVSFNKGSEWHLITAPLHDLDGAPSGCDILDGCSLHLGGETTEDTITRWYSPKASVGILIGSGNIGSSLDQDGETISTFVSRDNGVTWNYALRGDYLCEVANHGSVILLVPKSSTGIRIAFYSLDEGKNFDEVVISNTDFIPTEIRTDSCTSTAHFLVFGHIGEDEKAVLHHVSFAGVRDHMCSSDSDFEEWTPKRTSDDVCVMGRTITYRRRKPEAQCYLGDDFNHILSTHSCVCTAIDFECDYRYSHDSHRGCVADDGHVSAQNEKDLVLFYDECSPGDTHLQLNGYRKIPGNLCKGGADPRSTQVKCPKGFPSLTSSPIVIIGTVLIALVLFAIGWAVLFHRHRRFRRFSYEVYNGLLSLLPGQTSAPAYQQVHLPDEHIVGLGLSLDMDFDDFGDDAPIELKGDDISVLSIKPGSLVPSNDLVPVAPVEEGPFRRSTKQGYALPI